MQHNNISLVWSNFKHYPFLQWKLIFIKIIPQVKNFENISVNIYKAGSFSKFDVRVPDTSFSDDIAKPNEVNQTK